MPTLVLEFARNGNRKPKLAATQFYRGDELVISMTDSQHGALAGKGLEAITSLTFSNQGQMHGA